jgi:3-hydroxyisobutyrate dehydrogenase-like beta-hydroxyacid dehydrogenase
MDDNLQGQALTRVGVVGLGHMGHAFAVNLVEDGYQVSVYDRDPKRAAALAGARTVAQLADLADCDVVVTSLPDDDALAAVALGLEGLAGVLAPGTVHVSTSTVSPGMSRRVAEEHACHRQDFVAAPVLGSPDFARERKLFVLAAGPPSALEKVRALLTRLGQLLRKGGLDSRLAYDVLTNSLFDSRVHKAYGGKIVEGRYSPPGMAAQLAVKDLRLALAEAEHAAVPMPAASLVHDHLVAMVARGWAELDWSALGLLAAVDGGLSDGR